MKILLVEHDASGGGELTANLAEFGHVVRVVRSAQPEPPAGFRPDVVLGRLEGESAAGLDLLEQVTVRRGLAGAPILVTGSNEVALSAARRRFPEASFARLDAVLTALASIEAEE